jgi:hypothetical protein
MNLVVFRAHVCSYTLQQYVIYEEGGEYWLLAEESARINRLVLAY